MSAELQVMATTPELAQEMVGFLTEQEPLILGAKPPDFQLSKDRGFLWGASGKKVILDRYSAQRGFDRVLGSTLCRWAAIKVGVRKRSYPQALLKGGHVFPEGVPYLKYDGCESWPILVPSHQNFGLRNSEQYFVDDLGVPQGIAANGVLRFDIPFFGVREGHYEEDFARLTKLCGLGQAGPPDPEAFLAYLNGLLEPLRVMMVELNARYEAQKVGSHSQSFSYTRA